MTVINQAAGADAGLFPQICLEPEVWKAARDAHEARVRRWIDPHRARAVRAEKHPVWDFLFTYYRYRPGWLRQWHPGPGVTLAGREALTYLKWPAYRLGAEGVRITQQSLPEKRKVFVVWLRDMLSAMQARPAFYGCFGIHEWAMVYRQEPSEVRHTAYPLRFDAEHIAHIVETSSVCCTHYDAFRFFTEASRGFNRQQPARATSSDFEQRGCLHANMDLYKWAFKLTPYTPGDLVADSLALAYDIREIDMRASPYDLRELGFDPIPIETAGGRAEFERHQRTFAERGIPIRERLLQVCEWLLHGE